MIEFQPNGSLAYPVLAGIVIATAALSALATLRWNWKALPVSLFAGLALPLLVPMIVMAIVSHYDGWSGFSFHATELILIVGLPSALAGFLGVILIRKARSYGG